MDKEKLSDVVAKIKSTHQSQKITPRQLLNALGCERRFQSNIWLVNDYLHQNQLELSEDYTQGWIDREIELRHKAIADKKCKDNPVKTVSVLHAARQKPITIENNSHLSKALTLMLRHDISQLPVINGPNKTVGYISWETIGKTMHRTGEGFSLDKMVKEYVCKDIAIIPFNTPLLKAIRKIQDYNFVVVEDQQKSICGLITMADISAEFLLSTEPFLLIEQIENSIRQLLGGKLLLEHIQELCANDREVKFIDDLTFGEYIKLLEKPAHWDVLKLSVDKTVFISELDEIRKIRNGIMHFEPNNMGSEELNTLRTMAEFLEHLANVPIPAPASRS